MTSNTAVKHKSIESYTFMAQANCWWGQQGKCFHIVQMHKCLSTQFISSQTHEQSLNNVKSPTDLNIFLSSTFRIGI